MCAFNSTPQNGKTLRSLCFNLSGEAAKWFVRFEYERRLLTQHGPISKARCTTKRDTRSECTKGRLTLLPAVGEVTGRRHQKYQNVLAYTVAFLWGMRSPRQSSQEAHTVLMYRYTMCHIGLLDLEDCQSI